MGLSMHDRADTEKASKKQELPRLSAHFCLLMNLRKMTSAAKYVSVLHFSQAEGPLLLNTSEGQLLAVRRR